MNFRDFNGRSACKHRPYISGNSFRDRCGKSVRKTDIQEQTILPEKTVSKNISVQPTSQYINHSVSRPVSNYQQPLSHCNNSVYIQQPPPPVRNMSIPNSVPVQPQQSQFLYYTQNSTPQQSPSSSQPVQKPFIPVPPPQPPEKTDPSKFVEEYVPTPPPRMVKAKVPTVRKIKTDHSNNDFGGFGGTFDGDPDQSTPIADIPVMNSIDDYKL